MPNYICEAKVRPIKNQLYSPNTPNYVREQMFALIKNGLKTEQRQEQRYPFLRVYAVFSCVQTLNGMAASVGDF